MNMYDGRPSIGGVSVMMPPRQSYSFPTLRFYEIVICLKEIGVSVNEEELNSPEKNKEQIRRVLEQLTELCTGVSRDEMGQATFSGFQWLSGQEAFMDLHEDSVPFINFFRLCQNLMTTCGIQDFTIKDITEPSAKRLKRQLSGIINFAKFRDDRMKILTDLTQQREIKLQMLKETRQRASENGRKLSSLRDQTAEEAALIKRIQQECKELEKAIATSNDEQADIKDQSDFIKASSARLKDQIESSSLKLEGLEANRKHLEGQIVSSPERFRRQIGEAETALQSEQAESKAAEKKMRELTAWIATIDEAQKEVDVALENMLDIKSEVDRQKSAVYELDSVKQQLSERRMALNEIDQNINNQSRKLNRAEEKLSHLRRQAMIRGQENNKATIDVHKLIVEAETNRLQVSARAEKAEAEALRAERELEADKLLQDEERNEMVVAYEKLEKIAIGHLQALRREIEKETSSACCV